MQKLRVSFDIISTRRYETGVWMPLEWAAEDALAKISGNRIVSINLPWREYWLRQNRIARLYRAIAPGLSPSVFIALKGRLFLFMMGLRREYQALLEDHSRKKWIYLFDTWEPSWDHIERKLVRAKNLQVVYMSSSQSADYFRGRLPCDVKWLPQAAISKEFDLDQSLWERKKNTILNIGRSNKTLDEFFDKFAKKHGFHYIRPDIPGEINIENREEYLRTLYRSKIVVVHPRNLQYPEVTGCVSMLTARFFEAYQSFGVVCGIKPTSGEFEKVFGDLPFVSYRDPESFERDILKALAAPEKWAAAGLECMERHTWEQRLSSIFSSG